MVTFFIGYDDRESDFYEICEYSLRSRSSVELEIIPLKHKDLRKAGLFKREWKIEADGNYRDILDGKSFSTQFSFTRFLAPEYAQYLKVKSNIVFFVDCDFMFLGDAAELYREAERALRDKPVACVKHNYLIQGDKKIDGAHQEQYSRKLWSSLMAFNLSHPDNKNLSIEAVNSMPGSFLHNFDWVPYGNANIGQLSERWNFIPNHSEPRVPLYDLGAIHMTLGSPRMTGETGTTWSDIYNDFENDVKYTKFLEASKNIKLFKKRF